MSTRSGSDLIYHLTDPNYQFHGGDVALLTTMLYRVCDDDPDKFEEATRLIERTIDQILELNERDSTALQVTSAALQQIFEILDVQNQTEAIQKLKEMTG